MADQQKQKLKQNSPKAKSDDFAAVARRLGCDEDKDRFEAKLAKIAKAKPQSNK
jgi:hypothetical protein